MRTKTFDCVQMKREIQERFNEVTRGMTPAQRDEIIRRRAAEFHEKAAAGKGNFDAIFDSFDREQE